MITTFHLLTKYSTRQIKVLKLHACFVCSHRVIFPLRIYRVYSVYIVYIVLYRIATTSAVVGMFFPYRHVEIIGSRRRHACRHNSSFKLE